MGHRSRKELAAENGDCTSSIWRPSQFEENEAVFDEFVYKSHKEAYKNINGTSLTELGIWDLGLIFITPSLYDKYGKPEAREQIDFMVGYLFNYSHNVFLNGFAHLVGARQKDASKR